MQTQDIFSQEATKLLALIENTPKYWAEFILPELPLFPLFKRKLAVVGFGVTPTENYQNEFFEISIIQVIENKETGELYKTKVEDVWYIYNTNKEEVIGSDGQEIKGIRKHYNQSGEVEKEEEIIMKAPSVQYIKFLILNKQIHITDLFKKFMGLYYSIHQENIDIL